MLGGTQILPTLHDGILVLIPREWGELEKAWTLQSYRAIEAEGMTLIRSEAKVECGEDIKVILEVQTSLSVLSACIVRVLEAYTC